MDEDYEKMSTLNWIVGIFVTLAIVLIFPFLIYSGPVAVLPNDTVWTNEAVYQNPHLSDGSELGTAFWPIMVLCTIALIITFIVVLFIPVPIDTDRYELFERWDGRC